MRTRLALTLATFFLTIVAIAPHGSAADMSTCDTNTDNAVAVNGIYMYGTAAAFYQESNGIPGLQQHRTFCTDGRSYPPDTCIVPRNLNLLTNCILEFPGQAK